MDGLDNAIRQADEWDDGHKHGQAGCLGGWKDEKRGSSMTDGLDRQRGLVAYGCGVYPNSTGGTT